MAAVTNARGPMPADPSSPSLPPSPSPPLTHVPTTPPASPELLMKQISPKALLKENAGVCAYLQKRAPDGTCASALDYGCVWIAKVLSYLPFFYF